jgi:hypothetical protein
MIHPTEGKTIMALATPVSQKVFIKLYLNPFQQWKFFSQPRVMHDWLREHYGDLAQLHFQGRDYAAILTPQAVRQVFSADPLGYDAFGKNRSLI